MKKAFISYATVVAVFTLSVFALASCKKNSTNPNQQFVGTYAGETTFSGGLPSTDTVIIAAGVNSSAIVITDKGNSVIINATVSGNNITVPDQTTTVSISGNTAPVNAAGTGSLTSGTALSISLNDTITLLGAGTYSFVGAK